MSMHGILVEGSGKAQQEHSRTVIPNKYQLIFMQLGGWLLQSIKLASRYDGMTFSCNTGETSNNG